MLVLTFVLVVIRISNCFCCSSHFHLRLHLHHHNHHRGHHTVASVTQPPASSLIGARQSSLTAGAIILQISTLNPYSFRCIHIISGSMIIMFTRAPQRVREQL